jgi:hypothetical protein
LVELGEKGRKHSREAVTELSARMNFDASPFVLLMDMRAGKLERKQVRASEVAAGYLAGIEKVSMTVDTMQSSPNQSI